VGTNCQRLLLLKAAAAAAADDVDRSANHQWMMGEALLISPVLQRNTEEVQAHFTTGTW
jgi:alpha-glucosidase (family GH31 glycosyl hydrolase)